MEDEKLGRISQEIKEKQAAAVKDAVRITLEQLHELEKIKNGLQEQIRLLKFDLMDLKEGRLDRIHERQCVNAKCKETSMLYVLKDSTNTKENNPWYVSYNIKYTLPNCMETSISVNNSCAKMHASGTYVLKDGTIKYL